MVRMDSLVERFVPQLREALEIGKNAVIRPTAEEIRNVFLSGLGGSGIGGNFVQDFVREELKIPFVVGKSYEIPAFVGAGTLAIASSYSGNTEETLSALDKMLTTGARVVCVASGGKLIDIAKEKGLDYIKVPDNWPSPRACLGYSIVQQLYILHKLGLISERATESINSAAMLLEVEADDIRKKASMIAEMLHGKTPVIYINDRMEAAAVRLRQQINENAKMLCWHHVIPEMNHNELVGWRDQRADLAVIWLRNHDDYSRTAIRTDINKEIVEHYTQTSIEVFSKGKSQIEKAMWLVHLGDWVSVYLAELRNVDPVEIKVIEFLKGELAKV